MDGSRRVLIVDDEADVGTVMRLYLESSLDVRVTVARSGRAALELFAAETFHLVLSDFRMPGLTGLELLRRLGEVWPDTPRVLVTGYVDLLAEDAVHHAGIARLLVKPIDPEALRKAVVDLTGARPLAS